MKTLFMLYPGLPGPEKFLPRVAPQLISQQDLWRASSGVQPSLLFRVRTESNLLDRFSEFDRIESCVGMVDSVTRWRGVFRHAGYALNAIHTPALAAACGQALQVVASQHPSAVSVGARRQMADNIAKIADEVPSSFERVVAMSIANVVMADNDFEASLVVPFVHAFMPFEQDSEEFRSRLATIETMAGAMLLTEAAGRLAERIPAWLSAEMPEPLANARPVVGLRSDVADQRREAVDDGEDEEAADPDRGGTESDKPDGL